MTREQQRADNSAAVKDWRYLKTSCDPNHQSTLEALNGFSLGPGAARGAYQTPPQSKLMYSNTVSRSHNDQVQMPETFKYDRTHHTGNANASPPPITKEAGTECLNAAWTCRLAERSGAKSRVLSSLSFRVAEARFSLLGYHVTSPSWTGSTGSLGCARTGRRGPLPAC